MDNTRAPILDPPQSLPQRILHSPFHRINFILSDPLPPLGLRVSEPPRLPRGGRPDPIPVRIQIRRPVDLRGRACTVVFAADDLDPPGGIESGHLREGGEREREGRKFNQFFLEYRKWRRGVRLGKGNLKRFVKSRMSWKLYNVWFSRSICRTETELSVSIVCDYYCYLFKKEKEIEDYFYLFVVSCHHVFKRMGNWLRGIGSGGGGEE